MGVLYLALAQLAIGLINRKLADDATAAADKKRLNDGVDQLYAQVLANRAKEVPNGTQTQSGSGSGIPDQSK